MVLSPIGSPAETFLLITTDAPGRGVPAVMLSALEDGAMDAFFMDQHICFNDGAWNKDYPLSAPQGLERAMQVAREGGATKLLVLSLAGSGESEKTFAPEAVGYSLYRVTDRRRLAEGTVKAARAVDGKPAADEICVELGRQAAGQALAGGK